MATRNQGTLGRALEIVLRISAYVAWLFAWRLALVRRPAPARRFADLLQDLGTSFVKLGQHLSLRRDLFPPEYLAELQKLQDDARPFPVDDSVAAIRREFGKPPAQLFVRFDAEPFAAASVAQVHSARTFDGREVIVKVLRPGAGLQVDRDMRMAAAAMRFLARFSPVLARYRAEAVVREIWANLRRELDLREEARAAHRFAEGFAQSEKILIPDVLPELVGETVMVQQRIPGQRLLDLPARGEHAELAQVLVDAYVHQFFVLGFFHGDPHPGNIMVTDDGRLALHDFGIVGSLDRPTRHALAAFMLAFTEQDTEWVLDSWLELGMLTKGSDREKLRPIVASLLAEYSRRPIAEWSVGAAFTRLVSASRDFNFAVPLHLLTLARTIMLIEAVVRLLDPSFSLLDSLTRRSREVMEGALGAARQDTRRLQFEAALAANEWQRVVASSLRRLREEGIRFRVEHEGLPELSRDVARGSGLVALALVTLGLYLAASLLMQRAMGPEFLGLNVLACIFYLVAGWFTIRLVREIGKKT